ncbi:HAD-IIIC family phosphatase [Candidatus Bathyarchaeota archaeon]|nr:MAG: HAD-IIIC family phosphatase [Candidatus Bathyarchaeota archaeon]
MRSYLRNEKTGSQLNKILRVVRKEPTYLNYWNAYRRIQRLDLSSVTVPEEKRIRIAVLSSFTVDPLVMYIDIECRLIELHPETYIAPFDQYPQEILDENSALYSFNPDIAILAVHAESLLGDNFLPRFLTFTEEEKRKRQKEIIKHLENLISELSSRTNALILVNNFIVPTFSPLGILDNRISIGLKTFYQGLNSRLSDLFRENRQVYVVDFDGLAAKHGKDRCINPEMYYRGSILISESFLPVVANEYMGYIKALKNLNRKCIVLDLDNVLWGGILGEDGFAGIKLGGDPVGKAYVDFQKLLLSYYNRGIILAINSKNNYEDAYKVIQEHPNMVLREKHFAAMRINWKDKVENMVELAEELNIGLDSMVFIDDSPQERERMKQALPQVLVLDLPRSPFHYCEALQNLNDFNTLVISEEDKKRGDMYYAKKKRRALMKMKGSLEEFLRSLDIKAEIRYADSFTIPRVTSLINRTNQFNLTARRYNQAQVEGMCSQPDRFQVYTMKISDRFGDEGIVGVAIVRKEKETWVIDSFLMSCRVIGRGVETALLAKIVEDAKANGASVLIGEYIPTPKNQPTSNFYRDHNFKRICQKNGTIRWELDLKKSTVNIPDWVKVSYG